MPKKKADTYVWEPARQTPVIETAAIVVIGGGPGGIPAAVAAARRGAEVLVIEHYGFLGGLATAGQIGPLFGYNTAQTNELMLGGIAVELIEQLQGLGGAPPKNKLRWDGVPFEPEMFKHAIEQLALGEKKIRLLLHTTAVAVVKDGNCIDSVIVESKSGRAAVRAKLFIDATGDGDVAHLAGCGYTKGRAADGATQSMGTKFRIGGVGAISKADKDKGRKLLEEAIAEKRVPAYYPFFGEVSEMGVTLRKNEFTPTVTRARGDGTNVYHLTKNEIKLRADTLKIVDFCKQHMPGAENCYLMSTPAQIGVRETRQITGHYVLSGRECLEAVKFDDGVARGSWFLDIHCPLGHTHPISWVCEKGCRVEPDCVMKQKYAEQLYDTLWLKNGSYYEIPYRCLVTRDVDNLLVSGRCISADHGAMSSLRVMGTCMAIGEAAGTAAAMSLDQGRSPGDIPGIDVRKQLIQAGVPL